MTIVAAADGSALGNPGPAGWAWYVDEEHWASGGWSHGTNNMGELTAVLRLLEATAQVDDDLLVYCDSRYAINTITKWMAGWKRRGWRKGDGKPVMNLGIVQALDAAMTGRKVRFEWVKGHAGHPLNEAADRLANAAALAYKEGRGADAGPGYDGAPIVHAQASATAAGDPDLFSLDPGLDLGVPEPRDEDQVVAAERALLTEQVRADPAALAELLHPDWVEIGASGRFHDRASTLDRLGAPGDVDVEILQVQRISDDLILLLWRTDDDGSVLRSSLWQRDGNRWRQRFHQATPEGDPSQ